MSKPKAYERACEYVDGVLDDNIPAPAFVKRSCEKWKALVESGKCKVDEAAFNRAVRDMERMPCPEGMIKKFNFAPWQCWVLSWLLLFYNDNGSRHVREMFLSVPRKAGKSSMLAAYALHNLAEPCGGINCPEIICFGVNEKTAKITLTKANRIVLTDQANLKANKGTKFFSRRYAMKATKEVVSCGKTGGTMTPLMSGSRNLDGFTAIIVVADEISMLKNTQDLETLRTGFGAAFSPQFIMTSTPSDLPFSAYDVENARALRWLGMRLDGTDADDPPADDTTFAAIAYAATEDDDPSDPEVWRRTQPSYDLFNMEAYYEGQWNKAQADERTMHAFKTRHLCIPARIAGSWITAEEWLATDDPPPKPTREAGWWNFVGIDLSDVRDMTSICILAVHPEEGRQRMWFECYYPRGSMPTSLEASGEAEETFVENDVLLWERDGWVNVHEGSVIDHARIAERLVEINRDLNPLSITSDGFSALHEVRQHLTPQTKAKIIPFPKGDIHHAEPLAMLSTWVLNKTLAIQKSPVAERHLRNAELVQTRRGGRMLEKPADGSKAKIDLMDATLTAIGGWYRSQDMKLRGTEVAPHPANMKPSKFLNRMLDADLDD